MSVNETLHDFILGVELGEYHVVATKVDSQNLLSQSTYKMNWANQSESTKILAAGVIAWRALYSLLNLVT